ncbi:type II toxin-antitoxin system HigB family toxin [Variovorax sp. EL159]|uniref:type II toxin-antitoxin system HigB family toxin n=1 Tax=Variovorax sp. EL159 TaxID=1566270 RepID=UPI000B880830|nr:type II toxin-antitoxin system HigB family toxin [Variovorax sp. EL159]
MRLIGRDKLKHPSPEALAWLTKWTAEVLVAQWKGPDDVFLQFPKAKVSQTGNFLFMVEDQQLELSLIVAFPQGIVLVNDLREILKNGS